MLVARKGTSKLRPRLTREPPEVDPRDAVLRAGARAAPQRPARRARR